MKKEDRIPPIEAIEKTLRVKPIGRIQLFKRPEYMPKEKKDNQHQQKKESTEEKQDKIINQASHTAGRIGVTVDYKV
ncbi:MAG: hypothetical protein K0R78_2078 [Pelosinus sp.]|jgi:hypothetical protein|nr:hypothetical protein [Pelosinus sp.]